MTIVTISAKFQVVIPKAIRQSLALRPGRKLAVLRYGGRIELVPLEPMRKLRGSLKGLDTTVPRDKCRL